ncbi:hypothetical protein DEA8626_02853 [Defluviimonas aquaemixtae]|uniref:Uncharacterized protein n=1 Tax=Albidovulum aquaemixtae TaxID=1542388 RepID=A0A2R8BKE8_9RHOB|nr:hypothetical protein DEA8626_02853 [Defluviimonas aquaemixtae]
MSEKRHNPVNIACDASGRHGRPVDQDDWNLVKPRRIEFGPGARAAGVFRDDQVNPMVDQKPQILCLGKRATRDEGVRIGQGQRSFRRIDKPQKIMVLGLRTKGREVLLADGEEDASWRIGKCVDSRANIRDVTPFIARPRRPRFAFKGAKRRAGFSAGGSRVAAHLDGEWVRRVYDMRESCGPDVFSQPSGSAKATNPRRQGLCPGRFGASGIGKDSLHSRICQTPCKSARFGRAAEEKDAGHV